MDDDLIATEKENKRLDRFLQELQERGRSPRTLRAYKFDWSQFASWYAEVNLEPFTLERLAAMDVQDYITWGQQQDLKAATLNRRLAWTKCAGVSRPFLFKENSSWPHDLYHRVRHVNY